MLAATLLLAYYSRIVETPDKVLCNSRVKFLWPQNWHKLS